MYSLIFRSLRRIKDCAVYMLPLVLRFILFFTLLWDSKILLTTVHGQDLGKKVGKG